MQIHAVMLVQYKVHNQEVLFYTEDNVYHQYVYRFLSIKQSILCTFGKRTCGITCNAVRRIQNRCHIFFE